MAVDDLDVWLMRHFLVEAASKLRQSELESELARWDWQGPGVWAAVEESALAGRSNLFEEAAGIVKGFGEEIPVEYLNDRLKLEGVKWEAAQRCDGLLRRVAEFAAFLERAA